MRARIVPVCRPRLLLRLLWYVTPLSASSAGAAKLKGRFNARKIVVGTFDSSFPKCLTPKILFGEALLILAGLSFSDYGLTMMKHSERIAGLLWFAGAI